MKEIMDILYKNGYESFVVGGYVRDYLLGISSFDIDICTNAPIEKIIKIFNGKGKAYRQYFAYHIEDEKYSYDITTYRKESAYRKNKPVELRVAKTLGEDLLRRDFTINTFAIDREGRFVDILGAKKDLDNKLIRVVGNTKQKLSEDKTRILRAIRFFCTLDFDLHPDILDFIKNNSYLLNEVPKEYVKQELDKIFDTPNVDKFFYILNSYNITKYFDISFNDNIIKTYNRYGIWAQIDTTLPLSNDEKKIVKSIKKLVNNGDINLQEMDDYSSDIIYNAANILGIESKIKELYDIVKLHSVVEIDMKASTFLKYVKHNEIKKVYRLVEKRIIEGKLNNNYEDIEYFIRNL